MKGHAQNLRFVVSARVSNIERTLIRPWTAVSSFPSVSDDRVTYHEGTTSEQHPGRAYAAFEKIGIASEESSVFRNGGGLASL